MEQECANPRGSGACYLRKVAGACEGHYNEWYYDFDRKRCSQFVYSGCLGNGNRQYRMLELFDTITV